MKEKKAISTKLLLLIIMSIIGVVYADSMVVSGEKLDNVYIGETSTYYIVKNPKDGSFQTISKKRMDIRKPIQSDDRKELLKQWEAKRAEPKDNRGESETKVLVGKGDPVAAEKAHEQFLEEKQSKIKPIQRDPIGIYSYKEDVRAQFGEPIKITDRRSDEYGVYESWEYKDKYVDFKNGKVDVIEVKNKPE